MMTFFINDYHLNKITSISQMFSNYWVTAYSVTLISYLSLYGVELIFFFISFAGMGGLWAFCIVVDVATWAHMLLIPMPIALMLLSKGMGENYDGSLYDALTFYWRFFGQLAVTIVTVTIHTYFMPIMRRNYHINYYTWL